MSKSLVIVESPAKAKTIGKYLGKGFEVLASVGHIMDLPKNEIGVELEEAHVRADADRVSGQGESCRAAEEGCRQGRRDLPGA